MKSHSRPGQGESRRALTPRRTLIAVAAVVMAFGIAGWSLYLWSDYRATVSAAHARGQAALDALGEHTRRLVVTNDLLLQQVSAMLEENGVELYQRNELAWRRLRELADLPQQSGFLGILDRAGQVVVSSSAFAPATGAASFADTAFFEAHRIGKQGGLLIGPTIFSPLDDQPLLVFSRRWEWSDGSFRGVIASGVRADTFLEFAEKLAFGPKSTLSILRDDGLVLVRRPLTRDIVDLRLDQYELFTRHLAHAPEGQYDAVSPADGERRVVLYRSLEEHPLIMIAGLANDDILGRWQSRAAQMAILVALALGAIGAITAVGVRHADREARALQELQAARDHERLLVAEVDHRSRNLLSIIEAQIRQTARHSGTPHELAKKLSGRIQALASAHDLLSAEKWKEVDIRTLIGRELLPFSGGHQAEIEGASIRVGPKVAMSLAVVLHELATNAMKYGALAAPSGRVHISWSMIEGPHPALRLIWRETGGPPVEQPARKGFGMTLIERSLPHDLGGSVAIDFRPEGVQAVFKIPLSQSASGGSGAPLYRAPSS